MTRPSWSIACSMSARGRRARGQFLLGPFQGQTDGEHVLEDIVAQGDPEMIALGGHYFGWVIWARSAPRSVPLSTTAAAPAFRQRTSSSSHNEDVSTTIGQRVSASR